ncbi:MAG: hypothetical protein HQL31_02555 [Planctomycetes bacterium]|nr:hypothetical protein [Planctomycetota bacterium]
MTVKKALENLEIENVFPDELIRLPDLNAMGVENNVFLKEFLQVVDIELQSLFPFLAKQKMNVAQAAFFEVKLALDTFRSTGLILSKIIEELQPEEIILYERFRNSNSNRFTRWSNNYANYATDVFLSLFADRCNYSLKQYHQKKSSRYRIEPYYLMAKIMLRGLLDFLRNGSSRHSLLIQKECHDIVTLNDSALVSHRRYQTFSRGNYFYFVSQWPFSPSRLYRLESSSISPDLQIVDLIRHPSLERWKTDFCLSFFAGAWFRHLVDFVPVMLKRAAALEKKILAVSPKAMFTSDCRYFLKDAFFFELVRSKGIPVVAYQEGGGYGYLDYPVIRTDIDLPDVFLTYGEGVSNSVYLDGGRAKRISLGSIRLKKIHLDQQISRSKEPRRGIYVILDSIKAGLYQHYPSNSGFFSQAYRYQLELLETLKQFPQERFIIKVIPKTAPFCQHFVSPNISIESRPLVEVLHLAEGFIVEFPSTVLMECLATDRPVALLDRPDVFTIHSEAMESLRRRCFVSEGISNFRKTIQDLVRAIRSPENRLMNQDFRDDYIFQDDTESKLNQWLSSVFNAPR